MKRTTHLINNWPIIRGQGIDPFHFFPYTFFLLTPR